MREKVEVGLDDQNRGGCGQVDRVRRKFTDFTHQDLIKV